MGLPCSLGIARFVPAKKKKKKKKLQNSLVYSFGHIINPLLAKLVRSRWLDIDINLVPFFFFVFFFFMDLDFLLAHENTKK